MKKLFTLLLLLTSLSLFSQEKWYLSFSVSAEAGGPSSSIRSALKEQGFDDAGESYFFGFGGYKEYPVKSPQVSLMLRFGKTLSDRKMFYMMAGRSGGGEVTGFQREGSSDFFGIITGDYGPMPSIRYQVFQLAGGWMFGKTAKPRISVGPSLYIVPYKNHEGSKRTSFIPGANLNTRIPIGSGKRSFGIDLVADLNLAPPVKMQVRTSDGFHMNRANMISISGGLAYTFKKR